MSDNTILITGGASGIGLAFVKLLYDNNNKIIVCGRNKARLDKLKNQLPDVVIYQCDLSDGTDLNHFTDTVIANHPDLNILINNAGVQYNFLFTEEQSHTGFISEEVTVNLLAPIQLTDRLLPNLVRQNNSAIINITSALALAPKKYAAVYCATKSAMRSFTQALRYQLEGSSVTVFEIIPSLVDTDMTRGRGDSKITPQSLASKALKAIASDKDEILIGNTRILYLIYRLFPFVAYRLLKNS